MEENGKRFEGVMDHIAINSHDVRKDAEEYKRMGFTVETLYDDWAMLRDAKGFGIALLAPGSRHPEHIGIRVETREELEEYAKREGRQIKEHRDKTVSFYTKGISGKAVEVIYYPPDFNSVYKTEKQN